MPEDKITIDGLGIRYWTNIGGLGLDDRGRGTIVLFHGNSLSLDSWKKSKTLDRLSSEGYRVLAVDLPAGKGSKSDKLSPKVLKESPERFVKLMDQLFDALGVGSTPFTIVGPSMGGGFALAYALSRPRRVGALLLVSPSVFRVPDGQRDGLSALEIPVLLVWGDRDRVFPLEEYGIPLKEKLSRARLVVVKQARHGVYLDKPEEFNGILSGFIAEASH